MTPARLNKKVNVTYEEKVEEWVLDHAHIFLPLCFIILIVLLTALCYALVGVSATDSGNVYNHMMDVI